MASASVNLSEQEQAALLALAHETGKSAEELLHDAVQQLLSRRNPTDRRKLLVQAKGLWRDRKDLPNFQVLRQEVDSRLG